MAFRVVITDKAEADVEAILRWFSSQNAIEAGGRWFAQLTARLKTLEQNPERCSLASEAAEVGEEIRQSLLGRHRFKYRLLFRITGKTVQILRVWHSSRDAITRKELQ